MTHADSRHQLHDDGIGAAVPHVLSSFEALCLAARQNLKSQSFSRFRHTLSTLEDSCAQDSDNRLAIRQARALFLGVKAGRTSPDGSAAIASEYPSVRFSYRRDAQFLVLAGSTEAASEDRLKPYLAPLTAALSDFSGYLISGGTKVGACALAARAAAQANRAGATIELVGYLPAGVAASSDYNDLVRTERADFSILEPLQMWADLLASGVAPQRVTLLCFGGGAISAQELALAWALDARVFAIDAGGSACKRFSTLLSRSQSPDTGGVLLPSAPTSLSGVLTVSQQGLSVPMDVSALQQEV